MAEVNGSSDAITSLSRYARRMLVKSGVPLSAIEGSGPGGTVTSQDVIVAVAHHSAEVGIPGDGEAPAGSNGVPIPESSAAQRDSGPQSAHAELPDPHADHPANRQDELDGLVGSVRRSIPELDGIMIASVDGLCIAHDFPEAESDKIAAMAATALGLGKRTTERTGLGHLVETVIHGDHGYLVVYGAGENAVLVLQGPATATLGLMRIEARAASTRIGQALS